MSAPAGIGLSGRLLLRCLGLAHRGASSEHSKLDYRPMREVTMRAQPGRCPRLHAVPLLPDGHNHSPEVAISGLCNGQRSNRGFRRDGAISRLSPRPAPQKSRQSPAPKGGFVGNRNVDTALHAFGHHCSKPPRSAAGQRHRRLAAGQIDDAHVAPVHAAPETGTQGLGAGFLGGEAFGVGPRRGGGGCPPAPVRRP